MATSSRMLRYARSIVHQVRSQVNNQVNVIQDSVANQIQQMVQNQVDQTWRGKGADEFKREMVQEVLPSLGKMVGHCQQTNVQIDRASEIMHTADSQATGKVNVLVDIFRGIY